MYIPTQLSQKLQCDALGGLNILHVKQYLSLTTCPLIITSFVLGGGLYVPGDVVFGTSERTYVQMYLVLRLRNTCIKHIIHVYSL